MTKGELDFFTNNEIHFVAEQIGFPENEFKKELVRIFQDQRRSLRAYLVRVVYSGIKEFNVALCISMDYGEDKNLANEIAKVFRHMFGHFEHLDILFLNDVQESELRKVCCPFFSSSRLEHPDFFLTSSEGYNLEDVIACYKERRLMNGHPDGYMLCEIDPPLLGQTYGLGEKNIHKIVIASRHAGYSIFVINKWPVYVHVARIVSEIIRDKFVITDNGIESIGWAEIHESLKSAKASRLS